MTVEIEMRMVVYGEEEHVTVTVQEYGESLDLIEIVHRFEERAKYSAARLPPMKRID